MGSTLVAVISLTAAEGLVTFTVCGRQSVIVCSLQPRANSDRVPVYVPRALPDGCDQSFQSMQERWIRVHEFNTNQVTSGEYVGDTSYRGFDMNVSRA
jgi:hypothetical protein